MAPRQAIDRWRLDLRPVICKKRNVAPTRFMMTIAKAGDEFMREAN
jgi:hypothetical protein